MRSIKQFHISVQIGDRATICLEKVSQDIRKCIINCINKITRSVGLIQKIKNLDAIGLYDYCKDLKSRIQDHGSLPNFFSTIQSQPQLSNQSAAARNH